MKENSCLFQPKQTEIPQIIFFLYISGQVLFSVWISCYQTCRLGITYQTTELRTREISFHNIGKISDGRWHKIGLHMLPHSHPKKTAVDLYVDCKMLARRKLLTQFEDLVPASTKSPEDIVLLFAQRGGEKDTAVLTWKVENNSPL